MKTTEPTPIWSESEQRWRLDARVQGRRRVFTSRKEGPAGRRIVMKAYRDAVDGVEVNSRIKVKDAVEKYLEHVKAMSSAANHHQREHYCKYINTKAYTHKRLSQLTRGDWQDIISEAKPIGGKPLSKKAYSNLRSTIVNLCSWAFDHEMVERVPEGLRLPTDAPEIGKPILTPADIKKLFASQYSSWYTNAWRLMLVTGLRPGEVLGLQKADIDGNVLTVHRSINWQNQITTGKNKNARRTIVLTDFALSILGDQEKLRSDAKMMTRWIFPGADGGQPSHQCQSDMFSSLMGKGLTPYCLRHTFYSIMKGSLTEAQAKAYMGHSKDMDTYGVYGKKVDGEMDATAQKISEEMKKWVQA